MYMTAFVHLFPEQAMAETRTITTRGHAELPDDEYALVESYCTDPACDCRRVMLGVLPRRQESQGFLAWISFGFDCEAEMSGPFLDPLNPQSHYAQVFLDSVTRILETDPAYVARLESHYRQVKAAVADPTHPVHEILAQLNPTDDKRAEPQQTCRSKRSGRARKRRRRRKSSEQDRAAKIDSSIRRFIQSGDWPHPDLLAHILACGEVAVEPLIAIIGDPEMYWDDVQSRPRLLPEHAMGLLGDLRAEAAVPILVELLSWHDMHETLEQVVNTLARIGPAATEPTKAAVLDRSLGWYPRSLAAQALVAQVYLEMAGAEALLKFLQGLVRRGPVECPDDRVVYTLLAQDLADLQGMDALETVQAAFRRRAIDLAYID